MRGKAFFDPFDGREDARVGRREEPHLRDDEGAGVERRRAESLRERAHTFVVALLQDRPANLFPRPRPQARVAFQTPARGEPHGAVERDPAEELRVEEVARAAPHLPDALVRLFPARGCLVGHVAQRLPKLRPDWSAHPLVVEVRGVENLAVDVELLLAVSAVAHAHRARPAVAFQVVERVFGQVRAAVDAVHDLEFVAAGDAQPVQPAEEVCGLLVVAGELQGVEDERRVPQPREAVVPVADAPDLLRQRGGRRGDERPRRLVGQQLQDERAALDEGFVRPFVGAGPRPLAPVVERLLQFAVGVHFRDGAGCRVGPLDVVEGDPHALPGRNPEAGGDAAGRVFFEFGRAGEREGLPAVPRDDPALTQLERAFGARVIERGAETDLHLRLTGQPLDQSEDAVMRAYVLALVRPVQALDRHQVGQAEAAAVGREDRGEHVRPFDVGALGGGETAGGAHAEVSSPVPIEQAAEDGRAVEPRPAQPVYRAVARDERRRVCVADEPVVSDGPVLVLAHATPHRSG